MSESEIIVGDCRESMAGMPERSVQCVVTSPPYWGLRDYKVDGQLGLESTPDEYLAGMVDVFRAVRRVLRDDGTCWVNMGDSYGSQQGKGFNGQKRLDDKNRNVGISNPYGAKQLMGMPWRLAFALQADGWYLRSDIIWAKPNPIPESVTDRPTKSHEYMFLLTKKPRYYYDAIAVREDGPTYTRKAGGYNSHHEQGASRFGGTGGFSDSDVTTVGRNLRDVWNIPTESFPDAHFATFPRRLVEPCIKAGTSDKGCCPECGAPWKRVVEMTAEYRALLDSGKAWQTGDGKPDGYTNRQEKGHPSQVPTKNQTVGWEPGCGCAAPATMPGVEMVIPDVFSYPPAPCLVLDPFAGSGTTGVVAKQLGRSFVGCELNPKYAEMARKRIENPERIPAAVDAPGQIGLFEEAIS